MKVTGSTLDGSRWVGVARRTLLFGALAGMAASFLGPVGPPAGAGEQAPDIAVGFQVDPGLLTAVVENRGGPADQVFLGGRALTGGPITDASGSGTCQYEADFEEWLCDLGSMDGQQIFTVVFTIPSGGEVEVQSGLVGDNDADPSNNGGVVVVPPAGATTTTTTVPPPPSTDPVSTIPETPSSQAPPSTVADSVVDPGEEPEDPVTETDPDEPREEDEFADVCPVTAVEGSFQPTQAVWQDDDHFPDQPGKRIRRRSPTLSIAELAMIVNKKTLLFGVRDPEGSGAGSAENRQFISIRGTSTGTSPVPVRMRFRSEGAASDLDWTSSPLTQPIPLGPPCGDPQPFEARLSVPTGAPVPGDPAFAFSETGLYRLDAQLVTNEGALLPARVSVMGEVIATIHPLLHITPVVLSPATRGERNQLRAVAEQIALDSREEIPDYFPVDWLDAWPLGVVDLTSIVPDGAAQASTAEEQALREAVATALTSRAEWLANLAGADRLVMVMRGKDQVLIDPFDNSLGLAWSRKVYFVSDTTAADALDRVVAHEAAHTLLWRWSKDEMVAQCERPHYHNDGNQRVARGFQVTNRGKESRRLYRGSFSFMSAGPPSWVDQCTYRNLMRVLTRPIDPPTLLVRAVLDNSGSEPSAELLPSYQLDGVVDLQADPSTGWAFVVVDADGGELDRLWFDPVWEIPTHPHYVRSLAPVSVRMAEPPAEAAELQIHGPNGLLDTVPVSRNAPRVDIDVDAVRGHDDGSSTLVWAATDDDGDPLVTSVLVSVDDGRTWNPLVYEADDSGEVVVPELDADTYDVRVIVSDRFHSSEDRVRLTTSRSGTAASGLAWFIAAALALLVGLGLWRPWSSSRGRTTEPDGRSGEA